MKLRLRCPTRRRQRKKQQVTRVVSNTNRESLYQPTNGTTAPHARGRQRAHAERMASDQSVVVYPPATDGGRRVRVAEGFVGMAYTLIDIAEFLRRVGMDDVEASDIRTAEWIEWRGGGPEAWDH